MRQDRWTIPVSLTPSPWAKLLKTLKKKNCLYHWKGDSEAIFPTGSFQENPDADREGHVDFQNGRPDAQEVPWKFSSCTSPHNHHWMTLIPLSSVPLNGHPVPTGIYIKTVRPNFQVPNKKAQRDDYNHNMLIIKVKLSEKKFSFGQRGCLSCKFKQTQRSYMLASHSIGLPMARIPAQKQWWYNYVGGSWLLNCQTRWCNFHPSKMFSGMQKQSVPWQIFRK